MTNQPPSTPRQPAGMRRPKLPPTPAQLKAHLARVRTPKPGKPTTLPDTLRAQALPRTKPIPAAPITPPPSGGMKLPTWIKQGQALPSGMPRGWTYVPKAPPGVPEVMVSYPPGRLYLQRWTPPDYTPSYWEDPGNVAKWYGEYKAGNSPDWLDGEKLEQAYDYLKFANQGVEDSGWRFLHPDDPGRGFLQSIGEPPPEVTLPRREYQDMLAADLLQRPSSTWTADELSKLTPAYQDKLRNYSDQISQTEPIEEAPLWQRAFLGMTSSPWVQGAIQAGALGGAAGVIGGPGGMAVGALGGAVLGGGLGYLSSLPPGSPLGEVARSAMQLLDLPYQQVERAIGTALQYAAPDRPYLGQDTTRLLSELGAAWKAAGVTAETGAPWELGERYRLPASALYFMPQLLKLAGYDGTVAEQLGKGGRFDPLNLVAFTEWAIRKELAKSGFAGVDPGELRLSGLNQAWVLDVMQTPEGERITSHPVDVGYAGMAALVDARRRILNGEDPKYVQEELKYRFGTSGQVADLAWGVVLDPLNILPDVAVHGAGKVARAAGMNTLADALALSATPLEGLKKYQVAIREGLVGAADEIGSLDRLIGGLDGEGRILELTEKVSANPLRRSLDALTGLTPSSKARVQLGQMSENLGNVLLHHMGDPEGLLATLEVIGTQRPSEAAKISASFGSPEMYTGQRLVSTFLDTARNEKNAWDNTAPSRDLLARMANATGFKIGDLVKLLDDEQDATVALRQLEASAKTLQTPEALAFLQEIADQKLTPKIVEELQEIFTGKNSAPYDARHWTARLYGKFEDHAGKVLAETYKLAPDHTILRMADTLKKAQSFLLLGLNPGYLFNNAFNNYLTRAAGGIFGFASDARIDDYFKEIVTPYRFEAGVGAAAEIPEAKITLEPTGAEKITPSGAGEVAIRAATRPSGGLGKVNDLLNSLGKAGVFSEWSRKIESSESRQAFYFAHRKDWNARWRANTGFRMIEDPTLVTVLRQIDPGLPNAIYRLIEGSRNEVQLRQALSDIANRSKSQYLLESYLPDVARQMGLDPLILKDTLNPLYEDLRKGLEVAKTPEDVHSIFRELTRAAQEHADALTARQLQTRAADIATQAGAGGMVEASRLVNELMYDEYERAVRNALSWQEVYDLEATYRAQGVSQDAINKLFSEKMIAVRQDEARARLFRQSTYQGIFQAWGAKDPDVRRFLGAFDRQGKEWDTFYDLVAKRRDELRKTKFNTTEEAAAAQSVLEVELHEAFLDTQMKINRISAEMDEVLVDMLARQFGEETRSFASSWRDELRNLEDERQGIMRTHREAMLTQPAQARRQAWPKFYNEEFLPALYQHQRASTQALQTMHRQITSQEPPTFPVPQEPPPITPTVGEPEFATTPEGIPVQDAHILDIAKEYGLTETPSERALAAATEKEPAVEEIVREGEANETKIEQLDSAIANIQDELDQIFQATGAQSNERAIEISSMLDKLQKERKFYAPLTWLDRYLKGDALKDKYEFLKIVQAEDADWLKIVENLDPETYHIAGQVRNILTDLYTNGVTRDTPQPLKDAITEAAARVSADLDTVHRGTVAINNAGEYSRIKGGSPQWYRDAGNLSLTVHGKKLNKMESLTYASMEIAAGAVLEPRKAHKVIANQIMGNLTESDYFNRLVGLDKDTLDMLGIMRRIEAAPYLGKEAAGLMSTALYNLMNNVSAKFSRAGEELPELLMHYFERADDALAKKLAQPVVSQAAPNVPNAPKQVGPTGLRNHAFNILRKYGNETIRGMDFTALASLPDDVIRPIFAAWQKAHEIPTPSPQRIASQQRSAAKAVDAFEKANDVTPRPSVPVEPVPPRAVTDVPPGVVEQLGAVQYSGMHEGDIWRTQVEPVLTTLENEIIRRGAVAGFDLPPEVQTKLGTYFKRVEGDMATSRMASLRYAESARDFALLNYSRRRGFDQILGLIFPYQYWYTRSMFNWAMRFFDRPAWFSQWARLRSMQDRSKREGYPSRLSNKIQIPAPYLPEWAGSSAYVDPLRKVFPFEEFLGPLQQIVGQRQDNERSAEWMLQRWINEGSLSEQDARLAVQTKNETYRSALAAVEAETDSTRDFDWVSTIMQPALYLSLPAFMLTGKQPFTGETDMPLLPITRTGLALESATQDTPLGAIGKLIGNVLSGPEMLLRRKKGLQEFGAWGDYYVDRQLSNMAAEGEITSRQAVLAMQERSGEVFDKARERVRYEQGIATPGAGFLQSLLKGQAWKDPASFAMATLFGWLPEGLYPEGELEQRNLAGIYKDARNEYNAGNADALQDFFEQYPEYESRLALWDTPDERLRQFLISEVYDRYFAMDSSLRKQQAREQLGPDFEAFLGRENHDSIDPQTLATWSRLLGGAVPKAAPVADIANAPDIDFARLQLAPPEDAAAVDTYRSLREKIFPNWYALQERYFSLPPKSQERRDFLKTWPMLKNYFEWNRQYKDQYPVIEEYQSSGGGASEVDFSWLSELDDITLRQLYSYYSLGLPMGAASLEEMKDQWGMQGRPGKFESWLNDYVKQGVLP